MLWVKILVLALLALAVVSLFRALGAMMRGESAGGKTVRALAWRVGFSLAVFLILILSMYMGWIQPHDVNPGKRYGEPIAPPEDTRPAPAGPEAPPAGQ